MVPLSEETDIEKLREAALSLDQKNRALEQKNQQLAARVLELQKQVLRLQGRAPKELVQQLSELESQLARARQEIFGKSSEKRPEPAPEPKSERKPQTGHGRKEQPSLPVEEEIHRLDKPDEICPKCGGQLQEWAGQYEESEEIDSIERRIRLLRHKRLKYRCACQSCVETALGPVKLFPGARYSIGFAAQVACGKYLDHMPLERQVRALQRLGLDTDSQTLWDCLERGARLLAPLHDRLHAHVLAQEVIGADETRWPLLGKKGTDESKLWQLWAACAPDAVVYRLQDSRATEAAQELLRDYAGTVVTDGYAGYEAARKAGGRFRLAHCLAHVRRAWVECEPNHPVEAKKALDLIREIYDVEGQCPPGPAGDELRRRLRDEISRPKMAELLAWAKGVECLPRSDLGRAIAYMVDLWPGLTVFLDDPRVPADNNATERSLRGIVVGRKNHYGSKSRRGTEVAALFYSLLESAKLVGINPADYLRAQLLAAAKGEALQLPHETIATAPI